MVNVIVSIIIVIIGVTSLNIITSQSLLFLSSQVVVVAFVFGNTCKNVFESIIFLFVIHPYDVGDRCEIDGVQVCFVRLNLQLFNISISLIYGSAKQSEFEDLI